MLVYQVDGSTVTVAPERHGRGELSDRVVPRAGNPQWTYVSGDAPVNPCPPRRLRDLPVGKRPD